MVLNTFSSRLQVIHTVRSCGPISRVELVTATGLSAGSISNITRELVDHAILVEVRNASEGRGRPRLALSINAEAATLAGVSLSPTGLVTVMIADLAGTELHTARYPITPFLEGEALADALADTLRTAVSETDWTLARPYAAGISFFGTVESQAGILHWLPPSEPRPVSIQAMLEKRLGIPVFIDNDVNIIARAETWRDPEQGSGKRHFIQIGLGMGLSTTWDGSIQNGGRGVNPEFGHVKSSLASGIPCLCGASGCLCTVASIGAIVARAETRGPLQAGEFDNAAQRFADIAARATSGDVKAQSLFDDAGTALGIACANLVNVSNPDAVTLLVEHEAWIELAAPAFQRALNENLLGFLGHDFPVTMRCDDSAFHPLGAIALVQERLFQHDPLPDWS